MPLRVVRVEAAVRSPRRVGQTATTRREGAVVGHFVPLGVVCQRDLARRPLLFVRHGQHFATAASVVCARARG